MIRVLPGYIRRRFLGLFLFCLLSVIILFLVVDLVENLDRFIDKNVPRKVIFLYYLYYIPYIVVLTLPVATLLATVFSVGSLARHNEIIAMKSLGFSLYRMMRTLLGVGFWVSCLSFVLAEGLGAQTNRRKEDIRRVYLDQVQGTVSSRLRNLEIQEPPDKIITIGYYDGKKRVAHQVKVETFRDHRLVSRLDAPSMRWDGEAWVVSDGYQRVFEGETERAFPVRQSVRYWFQFNPKELLLAQVTPDEMGFGELLKFVERVRQSGGEVHRWMTDLHLRIAFPLSNLIIVLLSLPLAYNRRKKSLAVGFGISLLICFFYFGLVKMGQALGQKGSMPPFLAAWLGNVVMGVGGIIDLSRARK